MELKFVQIEIDNSGAGTMIYGLTADGQIWLYWNHHAHITKWQKFNQHVEDLSTEELKEKGDTEQDFE